MAMAEAKSSRKQQKEKKPLSHEVHHMEIHRSENGGHMIVHHFHPLSHGLDGGGVAMNYAVAPGGESFGEVKMPEHHVFGPEQGEEAMAHVAEHAGMKMAPQEKEYQPKAQEEEEVGESEA
jgi:hypothetical protein